MLKRHLFAFVFAQSLLPFATFAQVLSPDPVTIISPSTDGTALTVEPADTPEEEPTVAVQTIAPTETAQFDAQLWTLTLDELGVFTPADEDLLLTFTPDGWEPLLVADLDDNADFSEDGAYCSAPDSLEEVSADTPIPEDQCEEGGSCSLSGGEGTESIAVSDHDSSSNVSFVSYQTGSSEVAAEDSEQISSVTKFLTWLVAGYLSSPYWIDTPTASGIVLTNFTINKPQLDIYSKGLYIFVTKGNSITIWEVDGKGAATKKVAEVKPAAGEKAVVGEYVANKPFFNVGPSPMPAEAKLPDGVPSPAERYRLASFTGLTSKKIFLIKSGTDEAYFEVGSDVLAKVDKPTSGPTDGGTSTVGEPTYVKVDEFRKAPEGDWYTKSPTLADIVVHSKGAPHNSPNPGTVGHETVHGINNWIVNFYASGKYRDEYAFTSGPITRYPATGMYFGTGKGVLIKGIPGHKFSSVLALVPISLRAGRVDLYFTRPDQENRSGEKYDITYILDEANAYVLGGEVALELHDSHYLPLSKKESACYGETEGAGEFIAYALALVYYAKKNNLYKDEKYMTQLIAAVKINVERAAVVYKAGLDKERSPAFQTGKRLFLEKLKTDDTDLGKNLRKFIIDTYGESWFDGIVG